MCTVHDSDLDLLTSGPRTRTCAQRVHDPRLVIDSPVPGSGKTTVLEHLSRLCLSPLPAASLSSPALLTRTLAKAPRTVLIDEVDRNLDPKREGVGDSSPSSTPGTSGEPLGRPSFRPRMVGTRSSCRRSPRSPWRAMHRTSQTTPGHGPSACSCCRTTTARFSPPSGRTSRSTRPTSAPRSQWADEVRDFVRLARPEMPEGCRGRSKRWAPLRRVAEAAGGRWPVVADELIRRDLENLEADRADGMERIPPALTLLRDLAGSGPRTASGPPGRSSRPSRRATPRSGGRGPTTAEHSQSSDSAGCSPAALRSTPTALVGSVRAATSTARWWVCGAV